jgi:hypothetical protein
LVDTSGDDDVTIAIDSVVGVVIDSVVGVSIIGLIVEVDIYSTI